MSIKFNNNVVKDVQYNGKSINQMIVNGKSVYAKELGKIGKFYLLGSHYADYDENKIDRTRNFYMISFSQNISLEPSANLASNRLDYEADEEFCHIDRNTGQLLIDYEQDDNTVSNTISAAPFYYQDTNILDISLHEINGSYSGDSSIFYFIDEKKSLRNKAFSLDKPYKLDGSYADTPAILKVFDIYNVIFRPFERLSISDFSNMLPNVIIASTTRFQLEYLNVGTGYCNTHNITYYTNDVIDTTMTMDEDRAETYKLIADNTDEITIVVVPDEKSYFAKNSNVFDVHDSSVVIKLKAQDYLKNWMGYNGYLLLKKLPKADKSITNLQKRLSGRTYYTSGTFTNRSGFPVHLVYKKSSIASETDVVIQPNNVYNIEVTSTSSYPNINITVYITNNAGNKIDTDTATFYASDAKIIVIDEESLL